MRRTLWLVPLVAVIAGVLSLLALRSLGAQARPLVTRFARQGAFQRPRRSPHEDVSAVVAGAKLTIVYGRPYMRGRTIFGGLVPYGVVWCPGADEATTLESTLALRIGSMLVPVGPHTIWILPNRERPWALIVSEESSGFHTFYNRAADLGRIELRVRTLPAPVEQLTFLISPTAEGSGTIAMQWEQTEVSVPFAVVQ